MSSRLQSMGIQAITITSPTCFHNPLLREAASAWYSQLAKIPMRAPQITVYTPIGRRMITADDHIPTVLSGQLVRKFDLQGAIDDMVAAGFTRFVDCGSSGAFTRLMTAAGPDSIEVIPAIPAFGSSATSIATGNLASAKSGASIAAVANGNQTVSTTAQSQVAKSVAPAARPSIAIVAQGCLLPGGATSPEQLYAAITEGRSGIYDKRELDEFWESDFYSTKLTADRSTSGLVGLVTDSDIQCPQGVDAATFEEFSRAQKLLAIALAPCIGTLKEAERVLCLVGTTADGFQDQDGYAVLRYAGIDDKNPEINNRIGPHRSSAQDPYAAVKEVFDRIVRPGLDLTLVDAACASSLYAVALGMQALENNEADVVLAGGLFCPGPGNNCLFSQFKGLTSTGCRPFDAGADGVVFSEGAAVVVLERESDARSAGREIVAVVRGAGLSSDGRSPSANVPQTPGQMHAVRRCYENYAIDPKTISAIEAHGTSTPVGDATEIRTLSQFLADHVSAPLAVHSLKGLLGHTGWAAGTASLIAATQAIRTGTFPAQATFRQSSDALRDAYGVLKVTNQPTRLDAHPRIAVDGFGFGGSNAHVVVEAPGRHADAVTSNGMTAKNGSSADDELVIVGWHRMQPTITDDSSGDPVLRFDREAVRLPEGIILLPDLADDMDVSQSLALGVVGNTLKSIRGFNDDLRRQTGIVLALGGKTERAVEATTRVLSPRLARAFAGQPEHQRLIEAVN
ncbi:MAG: polyketide synthase, partial [Planctomycetota bacterium]